MVLEAFASTDTCTGLKKGVRMKSVLSGRLAAVGRLGVVQVCGVRAFTRAIVWHAVNKKCELVPRANALDAEIRGCELLN